MNVSVQSMNELWGEEINEHIHKYMNELMII